MEGEIVKKGQLSTKLEVFITWSYAMVFDAQLFNNYMTLYKSPID